ncbi:MAG: hypothetical protein CEN91_524 [Candidatus Berkelbacteria bacterium Licking1014_85]|uniref:Integral membrane protein CcmA involved in cell shape determination n=1 Tax=Candidatus Berkelbacteria bacterium Licking1014_85 TaxID=2017148 RepID=A0A554LH94_9BACT|nr:MAG: hypothetical protein CEN91_524 [Candidatus Berkelbacteria bacterium Licking1014_85]
MSREEELQGGTVVGSNVKLTGTIKDVNDIVVHGKVEGEVISEKNIVITEGAEIKGPVSADNVTISGKVIGSITAHTKFELLPGGNVNGSVATKDLVVQSGAILNGKCIMISNDKTIKIEEPKELEKKEEKNDEIKSEKPVEKDKVYELD